MTNRRPQGPIILKITSQPITGDGIGHHKHQKAKKKTGSSITVVQQKPRFPVKHPPINWLTIAQGDKDYVFARFGVNVPSRSGEVGGWQQINRPRNLSLLEWQGAPALQTTLPIILDGMIHQELHNKYGNSVESDLRKLYDYCGKDSDQEQPDPVEIYGHPLIKSSDENNNPVQYVIDDIVTGDFVCRPDDRQVVRIQLDLVLYRWISDDTMTFTTSASDKRKSNHPAKRKSGKGTYLVKKGDTLKKIAAHQLGSSKKWHELTKLNPSIRDNGSLKAGTTIKIR